MVSLSLLLQVERDVELTPVPLHGSRRALEAEDRVERGPEHAGAKRAAELVEREWLIGTRMKRHDYGGAGKFVRERGGGDARQERQSHGHRESQRGRPPDQSPYSLSFR